MKESQTVSSQSSGRSGFDAVDTSSGPVGEGESCALCSKPGCGHTGINFWGCVTVVCVCEDHGGEPSDAP